jgi:GNAT superfamily N-acetyltransferase
MTLTIRVATLEDLPTLLHLHAEMDGASPISLEQAQQVFQKMSQIPDYHSYLAFSEAEPVGTFSLLFVPTLMHPTIHKFALLDAVVVRVNYRSQGIGTTLVQEALKISAAAGCYKVTLSSNLKRDRAHAFYQSLGFKQHGWSFSLDLVPEG